METMAEMKLVISQPKDGKTAQKVLAEDKASALYGMKIGDTIRGDAIGFAGYEFIITGGSDHCGFPMRKDVAGSGRKRILTVEGIGVKLYKTKTLKNKPYQFHPGSKQRKTVCGNVIHDKITQVNACIVKEGAESLFTTPPSETAVPATA